MSLTFSRLREVQEIAESFGGRYAKRKYTDVPDQEKKEKKRKTVPVQKKTPRSVVQYFRPTDTTGISVDDSLFDGLEFCVMNGDDEFSKAQIELLLYQHGGGRVQTPTASTHYVIAAKKGMALLSRLTVQC